MKWGFLPMRLGHSSPSFLWDSFSKEWPPGPSERYSWPIENCQEAKRRVTSQRDKERICSSTFLKINVLRKGGKLIGRNPTKSSSSWADVKAILVNILPWNLVSFPLQQCLTMEKSQTKHVSDTVFPLCPFIPADHVNFLGGSDGRESTCNAGDPGSILVSGRSPGEGNGYPFQYSCLENSIDRGAWWATVSCWTRMSDSHLHWSCS